MRPRATPLCLILLALTPLWPATAQEITARPEPPSRALLRGLTARPRLAGTSVRSLQPSLTEAGTSYSQLVDELRLRTARELLGDERCALGEIAYELGYSDPAHFTRAFRRWTGSTPSAWRRAVLAGGAF